VRRLAIGRRDHFDREPFAQCPVNQSARTKDFIVRVGGHDHEATNRL
jgi:hypothetical protein